MVDYNSNCGNILAGIGPFAVDEGLVSITEPITAVSIYNTNTNKTIVAEVPVENGKFTSDGDYAIFGVPGTGSKINLNFIDTAGSKTGKLLPTGNVIDVIRLGNGSGLEVSIVDAAAPSVFIRAGDLGLTGKELPAELNGDIEKLNLLEEIRGIVAEKIGLITEPRKVTELSPTLPKIVFVTEAANFMTINNEKIAKDDISFIARTMSIQLMHKAFAVTGGICTSTAAMIPGTIVHEQVTKNKISDGRIIIGHPSGAMEFNVSISHESDKVILEKVSVARTARRIMEGAVYIPRHLVE